MISPFLVILTEADCSLYRRTSYVRSYSLRSNRKTPTANLRVCNISTFTRHRLLSIIYLL